MNDKFEEFHKNNKRAEENLKRINDQKSRTYFFQKNGKSARRPLADPPSNPSDEERQN